MRSPAPRLARIVPTLSNHAEPPGRRRPPRPPSRGASAPGFLAVTLLLLLSLSAIPLAEAVRISFDNCLSDGYIYSKIASDKVQLQFMPLVADAVFEVRGQSHNLLVTVWGNVTGRVGDAALPPPGDAEWDDPASQAALNGKIQNTIEQGLPVYNATTLHSTVDVLSYRPASHDSFFCQSLLNASCPLGPVFNNTPLYVTPGCPV